MRSTSKAIGLLTGSPEETPIFRYLAGVRWGVLGAALALHHVQDHIDGKVTLLGTPAEEGGGGKEIMARAGAFNAVDAAMMDVNKRLYFPTTPFPTTRSGPQMEKNSSKSRSTA